MEKINKICKKCTYEKSLEEFPKNGKYYKSTCKVCANKYTKDWHNKNPSYQEEYQKIWRIENNDKRLLDKKIYYQENKEEMLADKKQYYLENKDAIVTRNMAYRDNKLKTDPIFKMIHNVRGLIRNAFRRKFTYKSKKTLEILGCSFNEFKTHIESQFDERMNWDNCGEYWVFDHIRAVGNAVTYDEIVELNHYTNYQPLEKLENIRKGKSQ